MIIIIAFLLLYIVSLLGIIIAVGSMDKADKFEVSQFDCDDDNHGQEDKDAERIK